MLITIINSRRVNPLGRRWLRLSDRSQRMPELNRDLFTLCTRYQSLYLVPSSPSASDLVWTSKTFCPPQESDSGSSCIDRIPHSVVFVIGSMGILRRNRTFFPCTST